MDKIKGNLTFNISIDVDYMLSENTTVLAKDLQDLRNDSSNAIKQIMLEHFIDKKDCHISVDKVIDTLELVESE